MATSTARKLNQKPLNQYDRRLEVINGTRRKNRVIRLKSALFLTVAFALLAGVLTYYLMLQSDITNSVNSIASGERVLNELRLENDENYNRINGNVNLDEIRRVAIQELGMKYADAGQVVSFNGEGSDYVRQLGSIPK